MADVAVAVDDFDDLAPAPIRGYRRAGAPALPSSATFLLLMGLLGLVQPEKFFIPHVNPLLF